MVDIKVLISEADGFINEGDWHKASETYGKALNLMMAHGPAKVDEKEHARVLRRKAHAESRMGELMEAREHLDAAICISERVKDKTGLADAYRGLGHVFILLEVEDTAFSYYDKALKLALECNAKELVGRIHIELGNLSFHRYDFEQAKAEYMKAINLLERTGNKNELARAYGNLGEAFKKTRDLEMSITQHRVSIALSDEIGDETMKAWAIANVAECYADLGDLAQARTYIWAAFDIMEKNKDRRGLVIAYGIGSMISLKENDIIGAKYLLNMSLEICDNINSPLQKAEVLRNYARVYLAEGKTEEAVGNLKKALEIFEGAKRDKDADITRRLMRSAD